MIFEVLINVLCELLAAMMKGYNFVSLPLDAIAVLGEFCQYGAYIVGADLMLIFCSSVVFWMTVKGSVGLLLFLWRLLPFT